MKVSVLGASGLIGSALIKLLHESGYEPCIITRTAANVPKWQRDFPIREWNPGEGEIDPELFTGADVVVNLSGANISQGRWTKGRKQLIRDSRVNTNHMLIEALSCMTQKPQVFITGSAVGYYGSAGEAVLNEESPAGRDFLASVCAQLEKEAYRAQASGIRTVALRTGVVLSVAGGALPKMLPAFKLGLGGRIASGKQWFPWIHEQDMARLILFIIENKVLHGPINAAAPQTITNEQFTRILAKALHRPAFFPVPYIALRMLFGEVATALVGSQRISVDKILKAGFEFKFPELDVALNSLL